MSLFPFMEWLYLTAEKLGFIPYPGVPSGGHRFE